jgi:hypothetical protein
VRVHVAMNALAWLVIDFREHKPTDPAPSQDLAMGEVLRRLGVIYQVTNLPSYQVLL